MEQILAVNGSIHPQKSEPILEDEVLLKMFDIMILVRTLDVKGMRLQRQGRIGFNIPSIGQEATQIGAVAALKDEDWIFPSYREPGCALYRGLPVQDILNQWFGNSKDPQKGRRIPGLFGDPKFNFVNPSAPIGTQIIQAAGAGYGAKYLKDGKITLVFFGDGATSSADFHSGLNFAGVTNSPTIFFCQNNQWAISVPLKYQTASESIAIKGKAYGVNSIQVDGNDIFAVYQVVKDAAERARNGEGPTLIEALTYRMGPHTSSDDPTKYRNEEEVDLYSKRDPIIRFQNYLINKGLLVENNVEEIRKKHEKAINQFINDIESISPPSIEDIFTDVYAEMPWHLKEQMNELQRIKNK
ncbi:MAG: pyruvate dehydrogenase (acetyl-transferring) E1 component subunit alpha [Candidatus Hodarchaeales archaeon]|jgi:pyruvate dehydrogenase E1 component alpha subunit